LSRLRSGRATSRAAASAAPARPKTRAAPARPGVFVQTPRSDIYVALLGIAASAVLLGILLLLLLWNRYGFSSKVAAGRDTPTPITTVATAGANFPGVHL
jgi:hypothetical protein